MTQTPQGPAPRRPAVLRLALSVLVALVFGLALYLIVWTTGNAAGPRAFMPFVAGLILLPMAIASIMVVMLDPRGEKSIASHIGYGVAVILALVLVSMLFLGEGGVCAVMAAPPLMAGSAAGTWLTHRILRHFNSRKPVLFVMALPLLFLPVEPHLRYREQARAVTTVIEIDAIPAMVWAHTVAIPEISPAELPFTFSHRIIGVPRPENAALEGIGVGAVRQLRWSQGVRFQEIVTDWQQDRHLAWDFHFGPDAIPDAVERHISVTSDYLTLARGAYWLEPLPGGRTRLTLTTHYVMATPFDAYCAFWGSIFLTDFHSAVLQVIKQRAEAAVDG
jgi:hypothetical protein